MFNIDFQRLNVKISDCNFKHVEGFVNKVIGLTIEVEGIKAFVGEVCNIYNDRNEQIPAEVVGFKDGNIVLMPLGELTGISLGCRIVPTGKQLSVRCSDELLGRVIDGIGNPIQGDDITSGEFYSLDRQPPDPLKRRRIKEIIPTGIKAIDGFITIGEGQRIVGLCPTNFYSIIDKEKINGRTKNGKEKAIV